MNAVPKKANRLSASRSSQVKDAVIDSEHDPCLFERSDHLGQREGSPQIFNSQVEEFCFFICALPVLALLAGLCSQQSYLDSVVNHYFNDCFPLPNGP